MSWLLFLGESGHDGRGGPYEIRGGVALHAGQLWSFVQHVQRLELSAFGTMLRPFGVIMSGANLLCKDRFTWAAQGPEMSDEIRRKLCRSLFAKGVEKVAPAKEELTAFGQACMEMARGMFQLLRDHDARIFAAAVPAASVNPNAPTPAEFLRKDQQLLFERFFFFLESERDQGLIFMDDAGRSRDRELVERMHHYFTGTEMGRYRSHWIVPTPFFVSTDMRAPIQSADIAMYCINWGWRLVEQGMNAPSREEIAAEFGPWLDQLQFRGEGHCDDPDDSECGIVFVGDPYAAV